jgi:hypothetical protein
MDVALMVLSAFRTQHSVALDPISLYTCGMSPERKDDRRERRKKKKGENKQRLM